MQLSRRDTAPYYYTLLSQRERQVYLKLLEAFCSFTSLVNVEGEHVTGEQLSHAFHSVNLDHPEIIWVKWECKYHCRQLGENPQVTTVELSFHMSQEEAERCVEEICQVADPLVEQLRTSGLRPWEKVKWLHDAVINMADYDETELGIADKKECNHSIYGIFVNHVAVCEGYAEAMTYVLNRVGVECITCLGGDHAWNVITVDGVSAHLDVTLDDLGNDRGENGVCYRCFGLTTGEMEALHGFRATFPLPACQGRGLNYHLRLGFTAASLHQVHRRVREAVGRRAKSLELRLTDPLLLRRIGEKREGRPLWFPKSCARTVCGYRLFQPDSSTGWLRIELKYRPQGGAL